MPHPDWMRQYECCFDIVSEVLGLARLHLIPKGYEKDKDGRYAPFDRNQVYGLYVFARFEDERRKFKCDIHDFVMPGCFQRLATTIADSAIDSSPVTLEGEDGQLEIVFGREANRSLKLVCYSPSRGLGGDCLRMQLEGTVSAESLILARKQIGDLLGVVERINSGSIDK